MSEPRDAHLTGIFWVGKHVRVSALHSFGSCTLVGSSLMVDVIGRMSGTAREVDAVFGLEPGTTKAAVGEYVEHKRAIRRAERRASDWCAGYWARFREDHPGHRPAKQLGPSGAEQQP